MTILFWIIEYIASLIEALSAFNFTYLFFPYKKNNTSNRWLSSILAMITIIMNRVSLTSFITTLIMFILIWLSQVVVRNNSHFKLMFVVLLYFCLVFAIDSIFFFITSSICKIPVNELIQTMTIQRTAVVLGSKTILLVVCNFISTFKNPECNINTEANTILSLSTVFITVASSLMYLTQYYQVKHDSQLFYVIFCVIVFVMILVIYFSIFNIMILDHQKQEYTTIEKQNQLIINSLKEQERTFDLWKQSIHDYKNKMIVLDGLLNSEEYKKAHKIVSDELEIFKDKSFYISTGNKVVDIIINSKMNLATHNHITFTMNILLNNTLPIEDTDLCILLGNLIDNALEAVKNTEEKIIYIHLNFIKDILVIKIMNPYNNESFSTETSKDNKMYHGIGLKSVERIVEKYNGDFSITMQDGYVTALVTI